MKKVLSFILLLVLVFTMAVPVFAATPRSIDTISSDLCLNINNNTATAQLAVFAFKSSTYIHGTITLYKNGNTISSCPISGYGSVNKSCIFSNVGSGPFVAKFDGYCGADHLLLQS